MAGKRRGRETVGDMVRSLGLILVVVGLVVLFTVRQTPEQPVPTVNPRGALVAAAAAGAVPVFAPQPPPPGWRVTSARYDAAPPANRLVVGYQTPGGGFAAYAVADAAPERVVAELARDATPDGQITAAGRTWDRYRNADRQAWVSAEGQGFLIVLASGGDAELTALASALAPVQPA